MWDDPRAMLGGSDAGAHLDRMCGAPYTTRFLGDCLRGRKLVSLERAVQLITEAPAQLFGLRDRGVLARGCHADIVVFDPDTIGAGDATLVHDLPGDSPRLTAGSHGIVRVLVNGVDRRRRRRAHRRDAGRRCCARAATPRPSPPASDGGAAAARSTYVPSRATASAGAETWRSP